jgi:NAD dependent epimerase/dehydratase family enzyme
MRTLRDICDVPIGLPAALWMLELGAFFMRTETELIIKSRRVVPGRLLQAGFRFQFPELRAAVEDLAVVTVRKLRGAPVSDPARCN